MITIMFYKIHDGLMVAKSMTFANKEKGRRVNLTDYFQAEQSAVWQQERRELEQKSNMKYNQEFKDDDAKHANNVISEYTAISIFTQWESITWRNHRRQ